MMMCARLIARKAFSSLTLISSTRLVTHRLLNYSFRRNLLQGCDLAQPYGSSIAVRRFSSSGIAVPSSPEEISGWDDESRVEEFMDTLSKKLIEEGWEAGERYFQERHREAGAGERGYFYLITDLCWCEEEGTTDRAISLLYQMEEEEPVADYMYDPILFALCTPPRCSQLWERAKRVLPREDRFQLLHLARHNDYYHHLPLSEKEKQDFVAVYGHMKSHWSNSDDEEDDDIWDSDEDEDADDDNHKNKNI